MNVALDKQSHLMDADRVIGETIEFDNAVAVAASFARRQPGTLVLVLADHECSGFSLIGALTGGIDHLKGLPPDNAVTDPAVQPQRQKAVGVYDAAGFPATRSRATATRRRSTSTARSWWASARMPTDTRAG
jgi:alkaline phosphatase